MGNREVDTGRVIDEVRLRKILWDASDPLYKNKDARNKAWEDIVDALFENISGEEKQQLGLFTFLFYYLNTYTTGQSLFKLKYTRILPGHASNRAHEVLGKIFSQSVSRPFLRYSWQVHHTLNFFIISGKLVQQRWNVFHLCGGAVARDAFFRTKNAIKKTPSGSAAPKYKKYIYYDELSFLAPTVENEVDESLNDSSLPSPSDNILDSMIDRGVDSASSQKPWLEKRKRRAPKTNPESSPFEKELLTLLSNQTPDLAADDLAFFASLGPILKRFDVGQKLEFRSRVLREAMDI
ncbi:uncharacterized protein LOC126966085 [Leptidea sinapis]|uniref:uncharacterized protein LOC126966085 n=1 Tax=Leptidea sinapis TaxID=189913 RepID=UPI0021C2F7B8|nr:uncharacterized protein LOC126966085 [Leptidea sinapis]